MSERTTATVQVGELHVGTFDWEDGLRSTVHEWPAGLEALCAERLEAGVFHPVEVESRDADDWLAYSGAVEAVAASLGLSVNVENGPPGSLWDDVYGDDLDVPEGAVA